MLVRDMGRRGPPPKPAPLRVLEGSRAHRRLPRETPPTPGPCDPPPHLGADARAIWTSLAPELEAKGLLAPRYLFNFEVFCDAVVQYRRAANLLNAAGPIVKGRMGDAVSNPAAREFGRFGQMVRNLGADFGLTPASLTAIARNAAEASDGRSPERLLG